MSQLPSIWFLLLGTLLGTTTGQSNLLDGVIKLLQDGDNQIQKEPPDMPEYEMLKEYDFIIVGAGTAGCTLANRLSENPDWNVLLIEAGRPENFMMDLPILANYLQFTDTNWKYTTVPSGNYCLGFDNQQCNWPRGKVMGGSSVLNYMIYTRGNRLDYDHWASLGNTGWSYEEVLPYFKKVENFSVHEHMNPMDPRYHDTKGHLTVSYSPGKTKIAEAVIEASKQYGLPEIDYNAQSQIGVSRLQVSMEDGVRDSSSRAYLHPISDRPNLHVIKFTMVSKILIDPATKTAYGVQYVRNGKKRIARATKEVISSAGAINSPQLLMLSGIGPKKHLTSVGIKVLKDLKVGYNLMDHVATGGLTFVIDKPYSIRIDRVITRENLDMYLNHHQGPLTIAGGCEVLIFHDFSNPGNPNGHPEMELLYEAGSVVSDYTFRRSFGITDEIYDAVYTPIQNKDTFMVMPMLMRPKSKGKVMLKDANYKSKPLIYPNYFAFKEDMDILIKGIRLAVNISEQPALKAIGARLHDIPIPQCKIFPFGTDEYFECMTRQFSFTIYHQSGTCKMGPPKDRRAVVDPRLRVYGIKNLRVIDASIMPEIPAAHTNSPTYMIAEKGADMIKEDWGMKK
ncbi:glucose dehydrogenase [FAD, quinone] [Diabrotica virgifera virgifera]|uniref:Glucose dehydrogenase [FAD, quinone]-like n=1 Tax=Diabrotica virgifera virgifera TaxID=50390 RepID=A0A6P7FSQ0_DIAVI|nr:glucose dehydrogenase [FAD, quinone] [Diabrotica virgifera virgifera]XP_028139331.1 glucose dehydrogenase [FAD, quinone] [Diabrotica virgifera virgifera]XP_028139332.1 glucose dehydrogenase [FAD, quinone] [Diabrotica virgifera virgifera]